MEGQGLDLNPGHPKLPAFSHDTMPPPSGRSGFLKSAKLAGKTPLEEGMEPTPVFLPGESHGQRSLAGYSPWGCEESERTE